MQRRQTPILFSIDKHLRCDDLNVKKSADSRNFHANFLLYIGKFTKKIHFKTRNT